jgi:hypothetical protein
VHKIKETAWKKWHVILQLLPYHYELNPTLFLWAQVKYDLEIKKVTFKTAEVKRLILDGHKLS